MRRFLALACGLEHADFWVEQQVMFYRSGCSPLLQRLCELTAEEAAAEGEEQEPPPPAKKPRKQQAKKAMVSS